MIDALYLRSATKNDASNSEQHRVCADHAAAKGWSVGENFTDNRVSRVGDDRPSLDGLRDCLHEGRASLVIAADDARFFRNMEKVAEFTGWCESQSVMISYSGATGLNEGLMECLFQEDIAKQQQLAAGRTLI